jgi:preprotein translocase subunit SecG
LFPAWLVFHVIVCISLILVVLMQSSKGEGLAGSAFGGAGLSGAVFGGRGAASFLSKATTVLAIVFMFNCVGLAYISASRVTAQPRSGASTPASTTTESVITKKAQEERARAMQQQQQTPTQPVTGDTAAANLDQIIGSGSQDSGK